MARWMPAAAVWLAAVTASGQVSLVEKGQARAVVVTADSPAPIAAYAARELADHIELATGVHPSIAAESQIPAKPAGRVFVGETKAAKAAGIDTGKLATEEAVVRTVGNALYIAARDGGEGLDLNNTLSGSLWGVYDVLDRQLGVRWLWPGELGVYVPHADSVKIGPLDQHVRPAMSRRHLRPVGGGNDPRWGVSKEAFERYEREELVFLRRQHMGRNDDPRPYTGHSFGSWWRQYGQQHPEWFEQHEDGTRGPRDGKDGGRTSMCVSNSEFHQEIVRRWQEQKNHSATIHIGENDVRANCRCPRCRVLDDPQPTDAELAAMPRYARGLFRPFWATGQYVYFWQSVHKLASQIDPNVYVTAFLYVNYFPLPKTPPKLDSHIVLGFVPWPGWWYPQKPDEEKWIREQWDAWRATGATFYYRPNYTLDGYCMPHLYTYQLADMLRYVFARGCIATDFDSLTGQWATQGPTLYVLARLHSRPELTAEQVLAEYYAAFGPAARAVKEYFDYWQKYTNSLNDRLDMAFLVPTPMSRYMCYAKACSKLFPAEAFARGKALLDQAAAAAGSAQGSIYSRRVAFLQAGLEQARLAARLSDIMADPKAADPKRREVLVQLSAFRRSTEDLPIANIGWLCKQELYCWPQLPQVLFEKN